MTDQSPSVPRLSVITQPVTALMAPVLVLVDLLTGDHIWSLAALIMVLGFVLLNFRGTKPTARVFLALAVIAALAYVAQGASLADFAKVANQSAYLPGLVIVLTMLRIAAKGSALIRDAGEYAVRQPPSRRFILLASGGHIFGILLNIGGLVLLLDIAIAGRIAKGTSERVAQIQLRRITTAVMRGFAATIIWSPLGLSLNLLLTLVPGVTLLDYMPYGLAMTIGYLVLGYVFDRFQNPMPAGNTQIQRGGRLSALFGLLGVLVGINLSAVAVEVLLGLPLRAAILIVVPLFALGWVILGRDAAFEPRRAVGQFVHRLGRFGDSVNEICIMGSAGFLGLSVVQMIPKESVNTLIEALGLENGRLAAALTLVLLITSMVGINPLIIATILVTSVVNTGVPISPILLILSIQIGWAIALIVSPVTSTIVITSGTTGQPATTVGLRWNGPFAIVALGLSLAVFIIFGG